MERGDALLPLRGRGAVAGGDQEWIGTKKRCAVLRHAPRVIEQH